MDPFFRKVPAHAAVRQAADQRLEEALGKLKSAEEVWPWVGGGRNVWHGVVGSIGAEKPSSKATSLGFDKYFWSMLET